jgi:hypothetical protein
MAAIGIGSKPLDMVKTPELTLRGFVSVNILGIKGICTGAFVLNLID